ncbi:hypothetical protein BDA96_03G440300 [Sorghum bicolor]|uniref:DUF4408 domain-containing protein n=2 Tax=Sorghum bicolor TaxID=4558 RepID=A0A921RKL8_SORBI|nr:uncharacterized protein LOC8079818 [Sorghum bicolor]EES01991.1 hypothetical protein SORBI_3003G408200 [Sorghum bicolor]KAG0540795.1 hypothetical protein BDA96_03G440300 [Sorghum bicolor]|eukprot:XP_002456871.1 uncharacterized protein LOC8079818 [Sorghum bicolor]
MDPISMEKIRAMNKYNKSRRQLQLPTLSVYMAATFVLCLLLTSPAWFPRLCSALGFFFLTTLPDMVKAFLLSPKCLFVVGNLIVAFLVGESRLAPKRDDDHQQPSLVNEIHEEHVKKNTAMATKETTAAAVAVVAADHSAFVGAAVVEEEVMEVKEEEGEEEELHKRVEDFIARVKKQRKLELKSFFDVDR